MSFFFKIMYSSKKKKKSVNSTALFKLHLSSFTRASLQFLYSRFQRANRRSLDQQPQKYFHSLIVFISNTRLKFLQCFTENAIEKVQHFLHANTMMNMKMQKMFQIFLSYYTVCPPLSQSFKSFQHLLLLSICLLTENLFFQSVPPEFAFEEIVVWVWLNLLKKFGWNLVPVCFFRQTLETTTFCYLNIYGAILYTAKSFVALHYF